MIVKILKIGEQQSTEYLRIRIMSMVTLTGVIW